MWENYYITIRLKMFYLLCGISHPFPFGVGFFYYVVWFECEFSSPSGSYWTSFRRTNSQAMFSLIAPRHNNLPLPPCSNLDVSGGDTCRNGSHVTCLCVVSEWGVISLSFKHGTRKVADKFALCIYFHPRGL